MFITKLYKVLLSFPLLLLLLLPNLAFAETQEMTVTGEYNMSESETLLVAKERAVHVAMRNATERAGVYVESYSEVNNKQLTKDEINVISSGIIEVVDKNFERKISDTGGDFIKATITCKVSTDNIQGMMNKLGDKSTAETLQKIQTDYNNAMKEIQELKQQLINTQTPQEKYQIEAKIVENEQSFTATQWFDKGYDYQMNKKDYHNAIMAYNKAIALNTQNAYAYNNRGTVYQNQGQYNLAIADYCKAIELDPNYVNAYNNSGTTYQNKGQYDLAVADYNRAIALDPYYINAYNNRGTTYQNQGHYDLAIADYNRAIALDPNHAKAYHNRGTAYQNKGQYDLAIADYSKAIELDSYYVNAYHNRGMTYQKKGHYDLAIADYNKAIELDSHYAYAYYSKASVLCLLGKNHEAIGVFKQFLQYATPGDGFFEKAKQRIREMGGQI